MHRVSIGAPFLLGTLLGCALPPADLVAGTAGVGGAGGAAGVAGTAGSGGSATCAPDEVAVAELGVCIDRYEASKGAGNVASSKASEYPWVNVSSSEAKDACLAAGKRLCTLEEWRAACAGPTHLAFPYGDVFDPGACNGAENNGAVAPTGEFVSCEGAAAGLFDMSGNVLEWTDGCDVNGYCMEAGGSFQNLDNDLRCDHTYTQDAAYTDFGTGFRCCRDPAR